jgi:hypothetical protein
MPKQLQSNFLQQLSLPAVKKTTPASFHPLLPSF